MEDILKYFFDDPMRVLYVFGGTGGIWFWISLWRERVRVRIRIVKDGPYVSMEEMNEKACAELEIENIGGRTTSLKPEVTLVGYTPKFKKKVFKGIVEEGSRELPVHNPKIFKVDFPDGLAYVSSLFRTYKIEFTRGKSKKIRVWSAGLKQIGIIRYFYELFKFRVFHKFRMPET